MLLIRIRATGEVIGEAEFRRIHSNTSFPNIITDSLLNEFGADQVFKGTEPKINDPYKFVFEQGVEEINGKWYTKFVIGPVFTDTNEATAAELETQYKIKKDQSKAELVRAERDNRLTECDWVVIKAYEKNSTIPNEWSIYRQALRDIPTQEGFPHNVTWPEKP